MRDRHQRHVDVLAIERLKIAQVKPTMHRGDRGAPYTTSPRQVETGLVEMDHVEVVRLRDGGLQSQDFVGHGILTVRIETQRLLADRDQASARLGITAREQRDVVSKLHKILGQVRDHTFCTAIEPRRYCLLQWSNLRDPHQTIPPFLMRTT